MLRKDIKAFPYKLQTVHKFEEDNDRRVEMCETLLYHYKNDPLSSTTFGLVMKLFFICLKSKNRHNTRIWES